MMKQRRGRAGDVGARGGGGVVLCCVFLCVGMWLFAGVEGACVC